MKSEVRSQRLSVRASGPGPFLNSLSSLSPEGLYLLPRQPLLSAWPFPNMPPGAPNDYPRATFKDTGSLLLQPLVPDAAPGRPPPAPDPPHMISLYGFRAVESPLLLSPTCGSPLPCLPGSTLAFLMLMEVSTPGRKLKPPSSMKAGSSCPWTMTLAPVTVDSSGMKSFCSVRSVRDRPAGIEGAKLGQSWRCVRGWKPPLPPA